MPEEPTPPKPSMGDILVQPPKPDPATEHPSVKAWSDWKQSPSPQNMSFVLKSISPMIDSAVRSFPTVNPTIARGEARRLAIAAIKSYDPAHGAALSSHVFNHMRGLQRFVQENVRDVVSIPRSARHEYGRVKAAEQAFLEEKGRPPSEAELQNLTGFGHKKMSKLRTLQRFDFPESEVEGDVEDPNSTDGTLGLWSEFVYHDLNPRDQLIMDHKIGRNQRERMDTNALAKLTGFHPTYIDRRAAEIAKRILEGASHTKNLTSS